MMTDWIEDDGGRAAAGFKGTTGDCVTRAIAIVTGKPYREVYETVRAFSGKSPRDGVSKRTTRALMAHYGLSWKPTMQVGQGCRVHLREDELPSGRLVVQVTKHVTVVIDGVIHDTHDGSRDGTRCVYGYWS